jgi:hypothetical protein
MLGWTSERVPCGWLSPALPVVESNGGPALASSLVPPYDPTCNFRITKTSV